MNTTAESHLSPDARQIASCANPQPSVCLVVFGVGASESSLRYIVLHLFDEKSKQRKMLSSAFLLAILKDYLFSFDVCEHFACMYVCETLPSLVPMVFLKGH